MSTHNGEIKYFLQNRRDQVYQKMPMRHEESNGTERKC